MSLQSEFFAKLKQIGDMAAELPTGAEVTIEWADAPPDLVLVLALCHGSKFHYVALPDGAESHAVEWKSRGVLARAQRVTAKNTGANLRLVKR